MYQSCSLNICRPLVSCRCLLSIILAVRTPKKGLTVVVDDSELGKSTTRDDEKENPVFAVIVRADITWQFL